MDIKILLTVIAMTLTGGFFVWGMDASIQKVDHRLEQVEKTQRKVVDWMDEGVQKRNKNTAQRELLRQLCATGQVTDKALCDQVMAPPTRLPED